MWGDRRALTAAAAVALAAAALAATARAPAPRPGVPRTTAPRITPAAATVSTAPVVERPARPAGAAGVPDALTPLVADFDGDGRTDVLWYGPGAEPDHLWLGAAGGTFSGVPLAVGGRYEPAVGDFDGDGAADVFWYAPGPAADVVWFGRPGGRFSGRAVSVGGPYRPVPGDFDGDGRTDVLWYAAGQPNDVLWLAGPRGVFRSRAVNVSGTYRPVVGDFDGDGTSDIVWYGAGALPDAGWYGGRTGTFRYARVSVGGTYEPVVADLDGDRRRDVLWYGPGTAADVAWYGTAARAFAGRVTGIAEDGRALPGDFDGDGRGDVLVYAGGPGTDGVYYGTAARTLARTPAAAKVEYAVAAGDFGGDGRSDVFWYAAGNPGDPIWSGRAGRTFSSKPTTIDIGWVRPPPLRPEVVRDQYDPYGFVAHEMGGIDGLTYTNSLEAFQHNHDRGFRVFECDQVVLADGTVLVAHDRMEPDYGLSKPFTESTWADLAGHRYKDKYTFLRAQDLIALVEAHPEIYVILDFKIGDTTAWATYVRLAGGSPAVLDRLFPHVVDAAQLATMRLSYPVRNYVVALYRTQGSNRLDDPAVLDWAVRERVPAVMMWHLPRDRALTLAQNQAQQRRYDPGFAAALAAAGTVPMVHTVDDQAEARAFVDAVAMYTNTVFPPFG